MTKITHSLGFEEAKRQRDLIIQRMMPDWAQMVEETDLKEVSNLILTDSAFSDEPKEMELMGLAIRYATERGFSVHIVPFLNVQPDISHTQNSGSV